jgi:hypothetical protein
MLVGGCGGEGPKGDPGPMGMQGPKGDPGPGTMPSAGAVVPRIGLLDREMDVVVTVDDAKLDAQSTFDFGAGITVSNPVIVSATTAFVHLKIDKAAALGDRDVKINIGGTMLTAAKGFVVKPAIDVATDPAGAQQGGFALLEVVNNDTANALAPNARFEPANGLEFDSALSVTATKAIAVMLADPLAPLGDKQITISNVATGNKVLKTFLSKTDAVKVTARTPVEITVNTPKTGENLSKELATNLYKYSSTASGIVTVNVNVTGNTLHPFFHVFPASGRKADMLGAFQTFLGTPIPVIYPVDGGTNDGYVIASDLNYGGGMAAQYGYDLNVSRLDVAATAEMAGAHATPAAAQAITLSALPADAAVISGTISASGEVDVYSLPLVTDDEFTLSVHGVADVKVEVMTATGQVFDPPLTGVNVGAVRSASTFDPFGFSPTIDADGTWYIVVTGLTTGKTPTGKYTVGFQRTVQGGP